MTTWVRVDNIPPVAESKHFRQLFTSGSCKVVDCLVKSGSAFINFLKPDSAADAVKEFNGGEMNGRLIVVRQISPPRGSPSRWCDSDDDTPSRRSPEQRIKHKRARS